MLKSNRSGRVGFALKRAVIFIARFARFRENQCVKLRGLGLAPIMPFLDYAERVKKSL